MVVSFPFGAFEDVVYEAETGVSLFGILFLEGDRATGEFPGGDPGGGGGERGLEFVWVEAARGFAVGLGEVVGGGRGGGAEEACVERRNG